MAYESNYEQYQRDILRKGGFIPDLLTEEQKYVILEPLEAPENYHCDGEITPKQAFKGWCKRLRRSGLSESQFKKAIDLNF